MTITPSYLCNRLGRANTQEDDRRCPSAAAAERAGYRPCLRCRPETAPFCPAWKGTKSTVERALALIEAGAFDKGGVDALAERLGMGARHLSRLFAKHLDASPLQVALSLRLQRAKRLLDETDLPISVVAERAGFSSSRRMSVVTAEPTDSHLNPAGTVHGGLAATLLDSCMGLAILSTLEKGIGQTTLEFKISLVRTITPETGLIKAEGVVLNRGRRIGTAEGRITDRDGRLLAHGTTTCLIFQR